MRGALDIDGRARLFLQQRGVNRAIDFPGVRVGSFCQSGSQRFSFSCRRPAIISQLDDRTTATPFASFQGIIALQNGFAESGAGD